MTWEVYAEEKSDLFQNALEILNLSIKKGPEFTKWLKKTREYSFRHSVGINYKIDSSDEYDIVKVWNYDSLPNEAFLPFWEEECNDFEYCLESRPLDDDTLD